MNVEYMKNFGLIATGLFLGFPSQIATHPKIKIYSRK